MSDVKITDADVAAAWDGNAACWTRDVRAGYDLYRELYTFPAFLSFMPKIAGRSVIDLGCGEGTNTRHFAQLGARMTGVDLSGGMLSSAQEKEAQIPLGIRYVHSSYDKMPTLWDGTFEVALSTMALMDGPDFSVAMRDAFRVLVPGGELCFSILHPCFVTSAIEWISINGELPTGLVVGHYFDNTPYIEQWKFGKGPRIEEVEMLNVPRFPLTLSNYLNAVIGAGFRIQSICEPRPEKALSDDHAWLARWHAHAPLILLVSAIKPA